MIGSSGPVRDHRQVRRLPMVFLPIACVTGVWLAQAAPAGSKKGPAGPPARLVRLNVVALDGNGQAAGDLTRADFRVFDRGRPQKIVVFRPGQRKLEEAAPPDAQGFSNRAASGPRHATVILIDLLNEGVRSNYAWSSLLQALARFESSENLYLYVLATHGALRPVRGLPDSEGQAPAARGPWTPQVRALFDREMRELPMPWDAVSRLQMTYRVLEDLSSALAAIPGRKSIVWITHGMPTDSAAHGSSGGDALDYGYYLQLLTASLDSANVGIYPVILYGMGEQVNLESPASEVANVDALQQLADLTGGRVYQQDVNAAVQQAMEESTTGYLIGYEPSPRNWDGRYHKIRVACARPGIRIVAVKGYYAYQQQSLMDDQNLSALESEASDSLDAAEIGLRVTIAPSPAGPQARRLQIHCAAQDLVWLPQSDYSIAELEAMFVEFGSQGILNVRGPLPYRLRISAGQQEDLKRQDVTVLEDLTISSSTRKIRIVMLDRNSGAIGSVTLPASVPDRPNRNPGR